MVEHEHSHACMLCDLGRLFGRGVVVPNVGHDLRVGGTRVTRETAFHQGDETWRESLVDQEVDILCFAFDGGACPRVSTDDDAASLIVEAVTHGGSDWAVVHEKRRDLEGGCLDDDGAPIRPHQKFFGSQTSAFWGNDSFAVV